MVHTHKKPRFFYLLHVSKFIYVEEEPGGSIDGTSNRPLPSMVKVLARSNFSARWELQQMEMRGGQG